MPLPGLLHQHAETVKQHNSIQEEPPPCPTANEWTRARACSWWRPRKAAAAPACHTLLPEWKRKRRRCRLSWCCCPQAPRASQGRQGLHSRWVTSTLVRRKQQVSANDKVSQQAGRSHHAYNRTAQRGDGCKYWCSRGEGGGGGGLGLGGSGGSGGEGLGGGGGGEGSGGGGEGCGGGGMGGGGDGSGGGICGLGGGLGGSSQLHRSKNKYVCQELKARGIMQLQTQAENANPACLLA